MNARSTLFRCCCSWRRIQNTESLNRQIQQTGRIKKNAYSTVQIDQPTPETPSAVTATPTESADASIEPTSEKRTGEAWRETRSKAWHLVAGVLLSRPPLLLPDIHPFEEQVQAYQEMIERHQYSRFPINFFFKKGSIGEKRWKQTHSREVKKSGSGIRREKEDDSPEWIVGGTSDEQVMKSRKNAPEPTQEKKAKVEVEDMSDEEKRDLEQYAAEEEAFDTANNELPEEVNMDFHRLEREPQQTLYCLVKPSRAHHRTMGKPERTWTLIAGNAPGWNPDNKVEMEGLHMAAARAIERHLGPRVQTWVVGTNPAAYLTYRHQTLHTVGPQRFRNTREFIMKAYIFAGAVRVRRKYCTDHIWVTRDEMERMLDPKTFRALLPLLADR